MKHTIQLLILMALLISLPVYSQDDDPVYVIANRMPEFRGNLQEYLKQSIQYPQETVPIPFRGEEITVIREEGASVNVHGRYIIQ